MGERNNSSKRNIIDREPRAPGPSHLSKAEIVRIISQICS